MSNGSYNIDRIDQIYGILQKQGYLGTKEDLIRQMGQTDDFNRIMGVLNSTGFKGDERDLIYLSGINPKKKESAFSSDYVAGLESLTGDSSVEPVQDLESATKKAEENRSGYLSSLFGESQDPFEATASSLSSVRGVNITQVRIEAETESIVEAYSTEGSAPSEYQANMREYLVFKETEKWLQGRGVLGNALSKQEREGFSKEIFDTLKDTPLFTGTSVTTEDINNVMLSAGLIIDRAELSTSKENLKTSIINNEFGIGKYTNEQIQSLPEVEDEEGMSMPFYESQLGNINSAYIPQTDEELAAIQPNMPEKINTFQKASDYYERRNIEFSEGKYKQIAGYWNARNEVVQAEEGKKAAITELEAFADRLNTAVTEDELKEVQSDLASRRTDIINTYNEANEVLGLERRAYNISELIGQVNLDKIAMESDMALQVYRTSGEFLGRQLEENLIAPNLFKTVGMVFSGVLNFTDAILDTAEGDEDFFDSASFQDFYAGILGVEPDQAPTFGELSAGISQASNLKKGLTLEQIQRGVFGQNLGDEYARGVMFTSMVAEALPQIGLQIAGLATGATEATLISFALGSAGSTIEDLNQNSNLTAGEKLAFGTLAGGVEYLSEKLFMKAELGSADAIRRAVGLKPLAGRGGKALLWGTVPAEKGVLLQAKNIFDKVTTNRAFRFLEEGIEEGLVSVADQGLRNYAERLALDREIEDIQKKIETPGIASEVQERLEKIISAKEIQKAQLSVSWAQVADSFVVGVAAGGIQTSIVRAPSYVASKFRLKDQISIQNKYEELRDEFNNATTKQERDEIQRKMLAVQEEQHRVAARDLSFLANVSEEDAQAIFGHNQDITKARRVANGVRNLLAEAKAANNKAAVSTYEAQINVLQNQIKESFKQKFEIEGKYDQNETSIDIALEDPEVQAVIREVGSTDPNITDYGRVGRGNTVELTAENSASVIDRIINSGKIATTAFSNREQIIRGLRNIQKVVTTVTEASTGGKVFLHGTTKAFSNATGEPVARGVHVVNKEDDTAEVHLFLPALQANTPYHEAFHQATLQNENKDQTKAGTRRLATTFARIVPNIDVFSDFITQYLSEEQRSVLARAQADPAAQRKLLMEVVAENDTAADELLTEILSLITEGTLSVDFKAGLISGLKEFVSSKFGTSFKDPKLKAVVSAIQAATQTMARGEAVRDTQAIVEAGERLQEGATAIDEEEASILEPQVDEDGNIVQPGLDSQESVTVEGLPVDPEQVKIKRQAINVEGTYMANQPRVDIAKLLSDFKADNNRNPVVWVWMADQLKRGTYSNPDTGTEAEVLGGIGFSTDQQNQDNNVVWASGLSPKTLNDRVGRADYIFLMSGSPKSAHNFSKGTAKVLIEEIEAGMKRNIGKTFGGVEIVEGSFDEFVQITNSLLKDKTETKKWSGVLKALNSRGKDVIDHPSRKTFVQNLLHQGMGVKPSLEFHTFLHDELRVPKQDVFNQLLRDEYLAKIDAQTGDIVGVLEPTGIQEDSQVHDTYQHSILGKFVGTPTSLLNVVDIVPTQIVQQLAKAGADIEALSKPALIKTIAGDVGGVFSESQIDLIRNSIESLSDADTTVESVTKLQGIVSTVADIMTEPGFTLKRVGRGKNKKLVLEKSDQIRLFKPKKEEVLKVLEDSGMSKKDAEDTYEKAVQFARGRRVGRTEQGKVVSKIRRENNKLSTEGKKLREDLSALKNKVSTVQQFIREARKLIKDRMVKDKGASNVFTVKQLTEFFKVMSQLSRASAKKLEGNELEYIDAHLDKLAAIFDEQDAKGAMERHLKNLRAVNALQKTLKRKSKQRDFTTYADLASSLSRIKASLIPLEELEAFMNLLNTVNNNMRRGRFAKDEEGNLVFDATQLNEAKGLQAQLDAFKAIEQAQQQAQLRARAERAVERKLAKGEQTTFEEEYQAILNQFFERRLSATQKRVNKMAEKLGLDPRNVDDLETIYLELAKEQKDLIDLKKSLIINEGIMPLLLFNAEAILADPGFRLILGSPQNANIEDDEVFNKIRERLNKLEKHHLLAIEFKINDYLVNGRTFGLGYLAALTKGRINYADKIKELTDRGISSKRRAVLGVLDNLSSLIRNLFPVSNKDIARIKVAIGLQDVIMAINSFEQRHLETGNALQEKIDEINKKFSLKGKTDITSKLSQALSQIYSMSRQMPKEFVEEARAASRTQEEFEQRLAEKQAAWYKALRDSMRATIEDIEQNETAVQETIDQFNEAFDFLFTGEATLEALQNRVQTQRPEVVEMVDFMVDLHERGRPDLEIFAERFLGKELGILENYTPFQVRKTSKDEDVESVMALRNALVSRMQASSRGGVQKTPGATFEREQRAVGGDAILGLNFIDINYKTLTENAVITTALGDILAMEYAFGTEAFGNLVKDEAAGQLKQYIRDFLQVELQSEPFIFRSRVRVGDKVLLNPVEGLRIAAVVGAFGSILVQVYKQSTVGFATFFNMRSISSMMYFMQESASILALTFVGTDIEGKRRILSDPTVKLPGDKFELLKRSAVFLRDYRAGNIDPFQGNTNFNRSRFRRLRDMFTNKSLWALTTTDKAVAVASFFAYYADFLIEQGVVTSASDINWTNEAANPNAEALSYADNMLEKDQNTSSARMAAAIYKKAGGTGRAMMQMFFPYQSFAINTKRALTADVGRITMGVDAEARKDGLRGFAATMSSLFAFHLAHKMTKAFFNEIAKLVMGDDDDEEKEFDFMQEIKEAGVSAVVDALPVPSIGMVDDNVRDAFNYYVFFNEADYDIPGLEKEDKFALFKKYGPAIPTYGDSYADMAKNEKEPGTRALYTLLGLTGPAGQKFRDITTSIDRLNRDGKSYTTNSGSERFVRPEDQEHMQISTVLRATLHGANLVGLGSKELEYFAKAMDDMPMNRSLTSEEEAAAYEFVTQAFSEDSELRAYLDAGEDIGIDKLMRILKMQAESDLTTLDKGISVSKFKSALKPAVAEKLLQNMMPEQYRKHANEMRRLSKESSKKIAAVLKAKEREMTEEEYNAYFNFAFFYLGIKSEAGLESILIEKAFATP